MNHVKKYTFSHVNINLKNKNNFLNSKKNIILNPYLQIENYKVSKKTKENYFYFTNVLRRMLKYEYPQLNEEVQFCLLLNFNIVNDLLDKHFKEKHCGIYKNLFIFLCKFFNTVQHQKIHELYSQKMNFILETYREKRNQNKKNEKEEKNWVSFEKIENYFETCMKNLLQMELEIKKLKNESFKFKKYQKKFEKQYQEAIVLASYILCPPVRNDWHAVKIKNIDCKNDNYISFDEFDKKKILVLILNNYKTQKIYGKLEIPLSCRFSNLINKFLQLKKENKAGIWEKNTSEYLFQSTYKKKNQTPFSGSEFSKFFTRIMKKNFPNKQINIQMIRKIYTTNSRNFESVEKAKEISKCMGHSFKEHLLYFKTKSAEEIKKEAKNKQIKNDIEVLQYLNLEENKNRFVFNLQKNEWQID